MNLIIQGDDIATGDLKLLAKISGASRIAAINQQAFRLINADGDSKAAVAAHCAGARLDFGFVPAERRIEDFGLAIMDMDSTLITIECIDEIADMQGLKPEVAAITAAAMRGEIDFTESLRRRVALLAGLAEEALSRVYDERLRLSGGAETMLAAFAARGIRTLLVSGGFTFFTARLKGRLGFDYTLANQLDIEAGRLTGRLQGDIVDAGRKADELIQVRDQLGLAATQVIAIGDGANDLKMLAAAGVSVAFRARPIVQQQTDYALNFSGLDGVLPLMGGC